MKCSKCGKEMRKGYLFCSKDGAFSFANEVPGVFQNAKKADGFVEVTKLKPNHRTNNGLLVLKLKYWKIRKTAQTDNRCAVFESEKIVTYYKGICGRILLTHF